MNERETVELNGRTLLRCPFGHGTQAIDPLFPTEADLEAHLDQFHSYRGGKY